MWVYCWFPLLFMGFDCVSLFSFVFLRFSLLRSSLLGIIFKVFLCLLNIALRFSNTLHVSVHVFPIPCQCFPNVLAMFFFQYFSMLFLSLSMQHLFRIQQSRLSKGLPVDCPRGYRSEKNPTGRLF